MAKRQCANGTSSRHQKRVESAVRCTPLSSRLTPFSRQLAGASSDEACISSASKLAATPGNAMLFRREGSAEYFGPYVVHPCCSFRRRREPAEAREVVTRCLVGYRAIVVSSVRGQARSETNPRITFARPWRSASARMGAVTATWVWKTRRTDYANSKCAFRVGRGECRRRKVRTGREMGRGMVKDHSCKRVVNSCKMG